MTRLSIRAQQKEEKKQSLLSAAFSLFTQKGVAKTTVDEIATLMVEQRYYTLPVQKDGRLVGVVGMEDLLKRLAAEE